MHLSNLNDSDRSLFYSLTTSISTSTSESPMNSNTRTIKNPDLLVPYVMVRATIFRNRKHVQVDPCACRGVIVVLRSEKVQRFARESDTVRSRQSDLEPVKIKFVYSASGGLPAVHSSRRTPNVSLRAASSSLRCGQHVLKFVSTQNLKGPGPVFVRTRPTLSR